MTTYLTPQIFLAPLVDVQPAYNILHIACDNDVSGDALVSREFARMKLKESIRQMRGTIAHIEQRLRTTELPGGDQVKP